MDDETNGWKDGWTSHVKKLQEKQPQRPLLYVIMFHDVTIFEGSHLDSMSLGYIVKQIYGKHKIN
jgi:hypothetical protein